MEGLDILSVHKLKPLEYFGIKHHFFHINTDTVVYTWIVLGIILACVLPIRWLLLKKTLLFIMC